MIYSAAVTPPIIVLELSFVIQVDPGVRTILEWVVAELIGCQNSNLGEV